MLTLADASSWFKSLTKEQQDEYLEMHPNSKYGSGAGSDKDDDQKSKSSPAPSHSSDIAKAISKLPPASRAFYSQGGTLPGSTFREKAKTTILHKMKVIATSLKKESQSWKDGASALLKFAKTGKIDEAEKKAIRTTARDALVLSASVLATGGISYGAVKVLLTVGQYAILDIVLHSAAKAIIESRTVRANTQDEQDQMLELIVKAVADFVANGKIDYRLWDQAIKEEAMQAGKRIQADAHGDWFDTLSKEQQQKYLELHPNSEKAENATDKADAAPAAGPKPAPKKQVAEPATPEKKLAKPKKSADADQPAPEATPQVPEHLKHPELKALPHSSQEFYTSGGTAPGSVQRRKAKHVIMGKSQAIMDNLKSSCKEWKLGTVALGKLGRRIPLTDKEKVALKALTKSTIALAGSAALGGAVGYGLVGALAYLGEKAVTGIIMKAAAHGVVEGRVTANLEGDEAMLLKLIQSIADYAAHGDIEDATWQKAIKEEAARAKTGLTKVQRSRKQREQKQFRDPLKVRSATKLGAVARLLAHS